jgi:thiol-disulfide isomerase/thioredoxin/YHS domain-containing protein
MEYRGARQGAVFFWQLGQAPLKSAESAKFNAISQPSISDNYLTIVGNRLFHRFGSEAGNMRNINRLHWLSLGLFLGTLLWPVLSLAQQPLPWESTLENAQRAAAQSNRLVLIHFWAPWCGKCKKMESEVFNQPGFAASLLVNYVPVKINADQMPATATRYGITALPTDIIITPQGQIVDMMRGQIEATQYLARLNQIASIRRQKANEMAQAPAGAATRSGERPTDRPGPEMTAAGNQSVPNSSPSDDRYADYYRQNPGNQPLVSAAARTSDPSQPNPAPISPPYGQQQTAPGPDLAGPSLIQSPATPAQQSRDLGPPSGTNSPPAVAQTTPQQQPAMVGSPQPPAVNAQQQAMAGIGSSPAALLANAGQQQAPTSSPASTQPPANAPLCMDGYCPVTLTDKQQWISGDRRYGAIHRGRTYLFTGPEEQRRFFADPDRYAPVISGNDIVWARETSQAVPGRREHGVFYNGHVFLFENEASLEKFRKNPTYYATQALDAIQATNRTAQQMR